MADIARLRIELDEVRPRVWRRVEVPVDIHLDDLHLVIQAVIGWENAHKGSACLKAPSLPPVDHLRPHLET